MCAAVIAQYTCMYTCSSLVVRLSPPDVGCPCCGRSSAFSGRVQGVVMVDAAVEDEDGEVTPHKG